MRPGAGAVRSSQGPHPVALRVVLQLAQAQFLQQGRQVDPEPAAEALLEAVPATDWVVRGPAPRLHRPFLRRLLLVGSAQFDPAPLVLKHAVEIVDAAGVEEQQVLPTVQTRTWMPVPFVGMDRVLRRPGRRISFPGVVLGAVAIRRQPPSRPRKLAWAGG